LIIGSKEDGAHCKVASDTGKLYTNELGITLLSATPVEVEARSPASYHTDLQISFNLVYGLPKNSRIIVVVDPNWEPTNNYCQVDGLVDESDSS